jgi:hypothetical protein
MWPLKKKLKQFVFAMFGILDGTGITVIATPVAIT